MASTADVKPIIRSIVREWMWLMGRAQAGDEAAIQLLAWIGSSSAETLQQMSKEPKLLRKLRVQAQWRTDWPVKAGISEDLDWIRGYLTKLDVAGFRPFTKGPKARVIATDEFAELLFELVEEVWNVGRWYKWMGEALMDPCSYQQWPAYAEETSRLPMPSKDRAVFRTWWVCIRRS